MNFPHHREAVLKLLGCAPTREAIEAALSKWDAVAFETEAYRTAASSPRCARRSNGRSIRTRRRLPPCRWCGSKRSAKRRRGHCQRLAAAVRSSRARPDPHHRRSGRGPRARRARSRRDADFRAGSAVRRLAGQRTPAAASFRLTPISPRRTAGRSWRISSRMPTFSCKGFGRARWPRAVLVPRTWRHCVPASSMSLCLLTAMPDPGHRAAASTHWCRRRPALMPPKRVPPASKVRRNCRARRSIMPPVICWHSARSWRASVRRAKAGAGWCACHWRRPDAGSGIWAGSKTAFPVRCHRAMTWRI